MGLLDKYPEMEGFGTGSAASAASSAGSIGSSFGSTLLGALPFAGPVVSLLSGLFGSSPEEQYQQAQRRNLQRSIQAIRVNAEVRRARAQRLATRNISLATQAGSRRASFEGGTADPSVYTDPNVSRINSGLNEDLTNIGESEQGDIANVTAGVRDVPSYNFPHATDYVTSALGFASKYVNDQSQTDYQRQIEERRLRSQDDLTKALMVRN